MSSPEPMAARSSYPLPAALQPLDDWILYGLTMSDPVDRRLAIELGWDFLSEPVVEMARGMARADPDPYCRTAARALTQRYDGLRKSRELVTRERELTPSAVQELLHQDEQTWRPAVLRSTKRRPSAEDLEAWRSAVAESTSMPMVQIGLTLLARHGGPQDVPLARRLVASADPEVVKAALELLRNHDPEGFRQIIPTVVGGSSPEVRFFALRLLRSVDAELAVECLRECVADVEPISRLKAVKELSLLPFEETEPVLLDVMGRENRLLILAAACICVALNPSPGLPLKIFDMYALARGEKQGMLKLLLHLCVINLQAAGLLNTGTQEYLADLQRQIQRRKGELQLRLALRDLTDPDPEVRLASLRQLQDHADSPDIQIALLERRAVETDPDCRTLLEALLGVPVVETPVKVSPGPAPAPPKTPEQELREMGTRLKAGESFEPFRLRLRELFQQNERTSLQIETVRLAARFGAREDAAWMKALLGHQSPAVVAEAIRGLGRLDLDTLLYTINRWLTHTDPRIRHAVLEVYLKHDKEQALGYIAHMIDSPQTAARKAAVALLLLLDYSTAEPLLIRMFSQEAWSGLKEQVGAILSTNPSLPGLQALFGGTHEASGTLLDEGEELWAAGLANAQTLLGRPAEVLERECQVRMRQQAEAWRAATTRAARPAVPASRPPATETGSGIRAEVFSKLKVLDWRVVGGVAIGFAILCLGWFWLAPGDSDDEPLAVAGSIAAPEVIPEAVTASGVLPIDRQRSEYLRRLYKRDR